jgi:hypothetical protein
LVLRGVEPRSVYLSNDAKRINFSVMDSITRANMKTKHPIQSSIPYNALSLFNREDDAASNSFLDLWSIGIVILEILVGTEITVS